MIRIEKNDKFANDHFQMIKYNLEHHIDRILSVNNLKTKAETSISEVVKDYLRNLKNGDNLEKLILIEPEDISRKIKFLKIAHPSFFDKNENDNKVLYNIFVSNGYESNKTFDKYTHVSNINLDTCPYCNRNYIYYLTRNGKIKPQIDHFYPKDTYPILALSYYNLIPSCEICNGFGAKSNKDPKIEGLISPYLIENDQFKFNYDPTNVNFMNPFAKPSDLKIFFEKDEGGNNKVFKLEKLYQKHADHVLELVIQAKVKYSKSYRKSLTKYKKLHLSEEEIDNMILGNYSNPKDIHKRPLAKLYQDIGRELNLIK